MCPILIFTSFRIHHSFSVTSSSPDSLIFFIWLQINIQGSVQDLPIWSIDTRGGELDPNRSVSEVIHEVSHQPLSPNRVSRQSSFTPQSYSDNTSSEVYVFCMWIRIVSQGVASVHSVFVYCYEKS